MRLDQLPPAIRAQAEAKLGTEGRKRERATATGPGLPLSCTRCEFVADPPTEGRLAKHADEHEGGCRFEWSGAASR